MCVFQLHTLLVFIVSLLYGLTRTRGITLYCSIHFIVDYPLWTSTFIRRAGNDYFRTNMLLSTYIYRNVEGLNELYSNYHFPYATKTKNTTIQFVVHGISVVTKSVCDQAASVGVNSPNPLFEFCSPTISSSLLLDLVARFGDYNKKITNNHPACLYYGLTSRQLKLQDDKGIALGWSWRGHLCYDLQKKSNWSPAEGTFNPQYSGNVGIVTVSFDVSDYGLNKAEMTFFHEIGHSMNANHDNVDEFKDRKKECNPSEADGGGFVMYSVGTEGLLPNNRRYSHCSLDTIARYTENLGKWKPNCLSSTKKVASSCDGVFSLDEICDEHGTTGTCCTNDCKLKTGASCSPSAGSCCTTSCQFHPSGHVCRAESECKKEVICRGNSVDCPDRDRTSFKRDKTRCAGGTLLCMNGSCQQTICALHSLLPCQLKSPKESVCVIACQQKDGSCVPYHTIDPISTSSKPLYFPYGSSCDSNHGFCDQFHQCLALLSDDSEDMASAGFSSLLLTNYSALFKRYWWILLILILAQIILIPLVLLYFRSHCIPSDNPFFK